jgi:hypothetical protein
MAQYTTVLANEFNSVRDTVITVLGTGAANKGYGSPVTSYAVTTVTIIRSAEFTALRTDINLCYNKIAGSNATLNSIAVGGVITWANFVSYQSAATYIFTNSDAVNTYNSTNLIASTLNSGWGNLSGNKRAVGTITLTFASAAAMRFYFNQGNALQIIGTSSNSDSSSKSASFATINASINNTYSAANYRANIASSGTGNTSQTVNDGTSPYSGGTPSRVIVTTAQTSNTVIFTINAYDTGPDNNVASNVGINLTYTVYGGTPSAGLTAYTPSASASAWALSAS